MDHSLFWLPANAITYKRILEFVEEHLDETAVLEYKEIGVSNKEKAFREVLETIAAMANTDGGIILFGVREENGKAKDITGVDPQDQDPIRDKCNSLLQPAFVPEIIPVTEPATNKCVLVIRIHPDRHPHPVVLRDKGVQVRVGNRNGYADLYRLQQLFAAPQLGIGTPGSRMNFDPTVFFRPETDFEFMARFAFTGFARDTSSVLMGAMKKQILGAISNVPIAKWVKRRLSLPIPYGWIWDKPLDSINLTAIFKSSHWPRGFGPIWARLHMNLPVLQQPFSIVWDVFINRNVGSDRNQDIVNPLLLPFSWNDLYPLFMAGLGSLTYPAFWKQLPESLYVWSPRVECHILTSGGAKWLNLLGLSYSTESRMPSSLYQEAVLELEESNQTDQLDQVARDWLLRTLLDTGCLDAEAKVQTLRREDFSNL
ncbi:MAG: ATP-binding protein [Anaerolineae bacterium]